MIKYNMSEIDLQELNKLIEFENYIKKIYKRLILLESTDRKNTSKCRKLIEHLDEIVYLEDKLYNDLNFDLKKIDGWICYIKNNKLTHKRAEDMIISGYADYITYERIYYALQYIRNLKMNSLEDLSWLGIKIEQVSFGKNVKTDTLDQLVAMTSKLSNAYLEDYCTVALMFLEECIQKEINDDVKKKLIERKYYIIYIYRTIEKMMLNNTFEFPKQIYSNSKMVSSIFNYDDQIDRDNYFSMSLTTLINQYMNIEIFDKNYTDCMTSKKVIECLIKSKLANVSEDMIEKDIIFLKNNLEQLLNVSVARDKAKEVIDLLNNTKIYRERVGTITFGIKR